MRIVLALATLLFIIALEVTIADHDTAEFFALLDDHWMQIVLADLYLGILCFATVVWAVEGKVLAALAWGVAAAGLGNPVAALWLIVRGLPRIAALRRAPADE